MHCYLKNQRKIMKNDRILSEGISNENQNRNLIQPFLHFGFNNKRKRREIY